MGHPVDPRPVGGEGDFLHPAPGLLDGQGALLPVGRLQFGFFGLARQEVVHAAADDLVPLAGGLLDAQPLAASAVGGAFLKQARPDVAFITLTYPEGIIGNIQVSWVDSNKIRELVAIGSKMRIVFDDLDNLEKIRIFKKGISAYRPTESFGEFQYLLRDGDIVSPKIELHEPLTNLAEHFLHCISNGGEFVSGGNTGLEVVKVLEAIEASLRNGGAPVEVK